MKVVGRLTESARAAKAGVHASVGLMAAAAPRLRSSTELKEAERLFRLAESLMAQGVAVLTAMGEACRSDIRDKKKGADSAASAKVSRSTRRRRKKKLLQEEGKVAVVPMEQDIHVVDSAMASAADVPSADIVLNAGSIPIGQRVLLGSLSRADLNGKIGTVRQFNFADYRYAIQLDDATACISIKQENLRCSLF